MAEELSGPAATCPWCSAPLPDPAAERCPSCEAHLTASGGEPSDIKGVTTLDTEAILRARSDVARPRSRILSFITGEVVEEADVQASPDSLAPPPDEVRREMLRLQLEAERADLTAETVALKSDVLAQRGIHLSQLGGDEAVLGPGVEAVAVDAGAPYEPVAAEASAPVAVEAPDAAELPLPPPQVPPAPPAPPAAPEEPASPA
jgi:hypothetical protein